MSGDTVRTPTLPGKGEGGGGGGDSGAGIFQGALDEAKLIMAQATAASVDMAKAQANNQIKKKGGENAERSAP